MHRQAGCVWLAAATAFLVVSLAGAEIALADAPTPTTLFARVAGTPTGPAIQPGYLGLSLEYQALHLYTGRNPAALNPVLLQLIRNLTPAQAPVLRIGGDSADATWWPQRGVIAGGGVTYPLTRGWMRTTHALASALGARLILGLNLAAGRPALAASEARALLQGIGRAYVGAFEIGNEPDLYARFAWYRDPAGRAHYSRPRSYSIADFTRDFSLWRAALPAVSVAGPAFASLPWLAGLGPFLAAEPGLGLLTFHRYPLRGCRVGPGAPSYASIPNLLSDYSSAVLAQAVAPAAQLAHSYGLGFRLDELNSVACSGRVGVSDTFASALWMLDTLFNMAAVGVDGVNVHTLPHSGYELFTFSHAHGAWSAFVHPDYYGMLLFAQAAPPGSRLLPISGGSGQVKAWATLAPDGTRRVVLINKDTGAPHSVVVQSPGASGPAGLQWLLAPSVQSRTGVTLGGQSFGANTRSGTLSGTSSDVALAPIGDLYSIALPPASAAMLTLR